MTKKKVVYESEGSPEAVLHCGNPFDDSTVNEIFDSFQLVEEFKKEVKKEWPKPHCYPVNFNIPAIFYKYKHITHFLDAVIIPSSHHEHKYFGKTSILFLKSRKRKFCAVAPFNDSYNLFAPRKM